MENAQGKKSMNRVSYSDHQLWRSLQGLSPEPCIWTVEQCSAFHIETLLAELADLRDFRGTLRRIMANKSFGQKTKTLAWQLLAETKTRATLVHEEIQETRKCLG
jgi:hypothetical protein